MLSKLLSLLYRLAIAHRRQVYVALAILVPMAGLIATRLTISTSQKALLPPDHPVQLEYQSFVEEFGAVDALIAVVHGDDPAALKPVADSLAAALRAERRFVRNVFYKVDLSLMADHAPYLASIDELRALGEAIARHPEAIARIDGMTSLDAVLATLEEALDRGADGTTAAKGERGGGVALDPEALVPAVDALAGFFGEWRAFLDDPGRPAPDPIEALMRRAGAQDERARAGGYVGSRDGRMLFLFVQPTDSSDESAFLDPFLAEMRALADRVLAAHPEASGKVRIGFTGAPAHVHTEAETVFSDVANGLLGAVVLIIVIIFLGFRTLRKTICILVPLVCGMVLALGVITLTVGRLNLISAAFFAVMFGMSVDFSIYLIRRAEEERGLGLSNEEAVRVALTRTGRGVLFGGLTTCAAFFGTSLTDFSGFSELGVTAGIGIFVCLACVFLLTPALMLSVGVEPKKTALKAVEARFGSPRGRRWLKVVAGVTAVLAVLSLIQLSRVRFDYDALKLLPRGSESTELQHRMQEESDMSANSAVVMVDSLEEVRRVLATLKDNPEVSRVESMADLIPSDQAAKEAQLKQIRAALQQGSRRLQRAITGAPTSEVVDERRLTVGTGETARASILARIDAISERLLDAQEQAFSGGAARIVASLDESIAAIATLREALSSRPLPGALAGTGAFERALLAAIDRGVAQIATWATATPLTEAKLAPELRARFKSQSGKYVIYVFPSSLVWDVDALDRFMDSLRAATPIVTGFAATHQIFSRMVVSGFHESMGFAFLALLLMLFIDLRRPRAVCFAVTPLVVGFALMQGLLGLLGVDYNYASVAAYPVLLGYGSDYSLNIVHRWLERPRVTAFIPAFTVGKGVLLSATTSIAGLLSIVFARHKGVSDFGAVLLVGICVCFVTAVIVLPTLIDLVTHPKGVQDDPDSPQSSAPPPAEKPAGDAARRASV